jgi:hypothetical protein
MASLVHLDLGAVRGDPGVFASGVGSSFHVVVEVRALHRHEIVPSVGPTSGVQEISSGEQGGTFGGASPDVGAPVAKLLVQKFHGLALSGQTFIVPVSAVVLQLQNVEGSALASSFVDMDERKLWMVAFRERASRNENGHMKLDFIRVPQTHHGSFDHLT